LHVDLPGLEDLIRKDALAHPMTRLARARSHGDPPACDEIVLGDWPKAKGRVAVTLTAPATPTFLAYSTSRSYRLK